MPNNYGIKIYNEDGSSFLFNELCSLCKILGYFRYHPTDANNYNRNTGIHVPENYNYLMWFTKSAGYHYGVPSGGSYYTILGAFYTTSYLNDERFIILDSGREAWGNNGYNVGFIQDCFAIGWPQAKSGDYGISFSGYENFSSISDASNFSFVAYKGDIEISSGGWNPSQIDNSFNINNTVVFFYCDNPNVSISKYYRQDALGNLYSEKYCAYDLNGNIYSGRVNVKIVIFGNKELMLSDYGVRLYNKEGDAVFDIKNGAFIAPRLYSLKSHQLYEFKSISGISRPMVLPTSIGGYAKNWSQDRAITDLGVSNNGFQLAPSPTYRQYNSYLRQSAAMFISDAPVLVLDANNYFKFED